MTPAARLSLLFDWPSRHAVHVGLPLALIVSALLHAGGIGAFQLLPPKSPTQERRDASAYFLLPNLPAGTTLEQIIAAADPSLYSPVASESADILDLPAARYTPSFDEWKPTFAPPPSTTAQDLPTIAQRGPVRDPAPPLRTQAPPADTPVTKIELYGPLQSRQFSAPGSPGFAAPPRQQLLPAELLVAAAPDGRVLHAFLLSSSGNENLDATALGFLLRGRFSASSAPGVEWGRVLLLWGSDVSREDPR